MELHRISTRQFLGFIGKSDPEMLPDKDAAAHRADKNSHGGKASEYVVGNGPEIDGSSENGAEKSAELFPNLCD